MKNILIPFLLTVFTFMSCSVLLGQTDKSKVKADKISWMTWEEMEKAQKNEKRKVFVDIYTEWCGWCKKMDKTTFQNKDVIKYINQHYYAVKFDAETKKTIELDGKKYKYVKNGRRGYNQLAADLLKGKLSFPSTVFLNEDLSLIQPVAGYLEAPQLEMMITYFAEDQHKKTPWTSYQKSYIPMKKRGQLTPRKKSKKKGSVKPKTQLALPGKS